jgi:hypothetical protein
MAFDGRDLIKERGLLYVALINTPINKKENYAIILLYSIK